MFTFQQNRAGAVTMALIVVVSGLLVTGFFGLIELVSNPQPDTDPVLIIGASLIFAFLFGGITTALIAFLIHDLDARHWGRHGASRWLLVGLCYGIWWNLARRLLPDMEGQLLERPLHWLIQLLIIAWVYWLTFRVYGPRSTDDEVKD